MSCSKPLPPFICDSLYYLNRDQLEHFAIVSRSLKHFIDRYLHTKPYRVFDCLAIRGGSYALFHNYVQWHPNRKDYSAQQFLATQKCSIERPNDPVYYPLTGMRPYLGPTVRIVELILLITGDYTYNPEYIAEMESIAYLWRDGHIYILPANESRIGAEDLQLLLNSPTILQCEYLKMRNAHFSFKDYKVLYAVNNINIFYSIEEEIDLWQQYWQQFLEQPGVKPVVVFRSLRREIVDNLLDRLSKGFSTAISPSAFTILFFHVEGPLTEFRDKNYTSHEKLELNKNSSTSHIYNSYTLERSSI